MKKSDKFQIIGAIFTAAIFSASDDDISIALAFFAAMISFVGSFYFYNREKK